MKVCNVNHMGCFVSAKPLYFIMYPFWRIAVYIAIKKQQTPRNYYISGWYFAMLHVSLQRGLIKK